MNDITALGEYLIDFTPCGTSEGGQRIFEQNPGGAPVNVLTAISKLNLSTAFIGKVGNDMHGRFLKDILIKEGIKTEGLVLSDDVFTTLAFVALDEHGDRDFSFARKPGADTMLTKEEVNTDLIRNSKLFHIGSLSLTDNPAREATIFALETAKEAGCTISYDPNYRAPLWTSKETAKNTMQSVVSYMNIMKISDEETDLLTPYHEPDKAAAFLISQGVSVVAVTLGKDGCYVCTKDGGKTVPGFVSKVVDTTGAGDSFWGGFLYQYLQSGKTFSEITTEDAASFAKFANAVASCCVEGRGGIPSMPTLDKVEARMNSK